MHAFLLRHAAHHNTRASSHTLTRSAGIQVTLLRRVSTPQGATPGDVVATHPLLNTRSAAEHEAATHPIRALLTLSTCSAATESAALASPVN